MRFEEIRIGDIDGFGWDDGAGHAANDPAVASANDDLLNLPDIAADGAAEDAFAETLPRNTHRLCHQTGGSPSSFRKLLCVAAASAMRWSMSTKFL